MLHPNLQGHPETAGRDGEEAAAADSGERSARALRKLKLLSLSRSESPRILAGHGSTVRHHSRTHLKVETTGTCLIRGLLLWRTSSLVLLYNAREIV